jgi:hypothetical protein
VHSSSSLTLSFTDVTEGSLSDSVLHNVVVKYVTLNNTDKVSNLYWNRVWIIVINNRLRLPRTVLELGQLVVAEDFPVTAISHILY